MLKLGVNIDHVATLRQARYPGMLDSHNCEPDMVEAARACEAGGAAGITVHLRADRRHIQDADVFRLRREIRTRLNFEMGNTPEILAVALALKPDEACMVPETREEITTEGGLDVVRAEKALAETVKRLQGEGIRVSMFIEPEAAQVEASARIGADMVELHTGAFANAQGTAQDREVARLIEAANRAHAAGLQVNAGHGINYSNIDKIRVIPHVADLNIGHSIVCRAVFVGLQAAVAQMVRRMGGGE
jgi:pyridoxine 5-phosphate synthase